MSHHLARRVRRGVLGLVATAAALLAILLGATSALAAGSTITGGPVTAYCVSGTGCPYPSQARFGNGQQVYMYCYFDDYNRFFQVSAPPYAGRWVVNANNVANQTRVGHC